MTSEDPGARLKADLCTSFVVRPDGDDRWAIRTPMLYGDGDALPIFVERTAGGWVLTDDGLTVSHLFFDDFRYTDARFGRIEMLVDAHEAELGPGHVIRIPLDSFPDAFDVGDYLQLLAQVQGVALTVQTDRDQQRYITNVRSRVEARLANAAYEPNWTPPGLDRVTRARYRCDMRIPAPDTDVLLFVASTSDKANVSALSLHQFRKVTAGFKPVLAYHPDRVTSEAVFRFQDEAGSDDSVIETRPEETLALERALQRRGVELIEA
jgi:hypothetical protein